jgi:hypothetical protein
VANKQQFKKARVFARVTIRRDRVEMGRPNNIEGPTVVRMKGDEMLIGKRLDVIFGAMQFSILRVMSCGG